MLDLMLRNMAKRYGLKICIIYSFLITGCDYRDGATYKLWQDTEKEECVLVRKTDLTTKQLYELHNKRIKFYSFDEKFYFVERKKSTGMVILKYSFKTLATPVTMVVDGLTLFGMCQLQIPLKW